MRGLLAIAVLVVACDTPGSRRCEGNVLQSYTYDDDLRDDVWQGTAPCADGSRCLELVVEQEVAGPIDWAICAADPDPSPLCVTGTGKHCTDSTHYATCLDGHRDAPDVACPRTRPSCVEPEPGVAMCVADPAPSPLCAGVPARPMSVCAGDQIACRDVELQQACTPDGHSVMCFHDILIEDDDCAAKGAHCIESRWADVWQCEL